MLSLVLRMATVGPVLQLAYKSFRYGFISCLQVIQQPTLIVQNIAAVDIYLLYNLYECLLCYILSPSISCGTLKINVVWRCSPLELSLVILNQLVMWFFFLFSAIKLGGKLGRVFLLTLPVTELSSSILFSVQAKQNHICITG